MKYQTKGTCSTSIDVEVENGKVKFVEFFGGCNGNLKGIANLVTGMSVDEAITKLKGIRCGFKTTCIGHFTNASKAFYHVISLSFSSSFGFPLM